jgi:hypothetical protein
MISDELSFRIFSPDLTGAFLLVSSFAYPLLSQSATFLAVLFLKYFEYTGWFKYYRDWFVCKQAAISPGHIWTTLYLFLLVLSCLRASARNKGPFQIVHLTTQLSSFWNDNYRFSKAGKDSNTIFQIILKTESQKKSCRHERSNYSKLLLARKKNL